MNIETVLIVGFIFFVMILFIAGMFIFPEIFGISKNSKSSENESDNDANKN